MLTIEEDGKDKEKATNEIGVFIPTMDLIPDISGRTVTVDALLTQTAIATYLHDRGADFLFVAKGNQKTLSNDIKAFFASQPGSPTLPHNHRNRRTDASRSGRSGPQPNRSRVSASPGSSRCS